MPRRVTCRKLSGSFSLQKKGGPRFIYAFVIAARWKCRFSLNSKVSLEQWDASVAKEKAGLRLNTRYERHAVTWEHPWMFRIADSNFSLSPSNEFLVFPSIYFVLIPRYGIREGFVGIETFLVEWNWDWNFLEEREIEIAEISRNSKLVDVIRFDRRCDDNGSNLGNFSFAMIITVI